MRVWPCEDPGLGAASVASYSTSARGGAGASAAAARGQDAGGAVVDGTVQVSTVVKRYDLVFTAGNKTDGHEQTRSARYREFARFTASTFPHPVIPRRTTRTKVRDHE